MHHYHHQRQGRIHYGFAGSQGGAAGGKVIATGTPEEVAANPASVTGDFLKELLLKITLFSQAYTQF